MYKGYVTGGMLPPEERTLTMKRRLLALIAPVFMISLTACVNTDGGQTRASGLPEAKPASFAMQEVVCSKTDDLTAIARARAEKSSWIGTKFEGTIDGGGNPIDHAITVLSIVGTTPTVLVEMGEIKDTILGKTYPPLCYTVTGGYVDNEKLSTESRSWRTTYVRQGNGVRVDSRMKNPGSTDWVTQRKGLLTGATARMASN